MNASVETAAHQPARDCALCPRLCAFRLQNQAKFPTKWNAPVPSFGPLNAPLLIVGLGPGLKGANFSGRPFTGDYAGDMLYPLLIELGLATGSYGATYGVFEGDDLALKGCRITNAVRCVPPQNKPEPAEIKTCNRFLTAEIEAMQQAGGAKRIVVLGRVAHEAVLRALGLRVAAYPFAHAAHHQLPNGITLSCSYHCSRYNVNTKRLDKEMLKGVVSLPA